MTRWPVLVMYWDDMYGWMSWQVHDTPMCPCHTYLSAPSLLRQTLTDRHVSFGISPFCFLFKSVFISPTSTKTLTIKNPKHFQYNSSPFESWKEQDVLMMNVDSLSSSWLKSKDTTFVYPLCFYPLYYITGLGDIISEGEDAASSIRWPVVEYNYSNERCPARLCPWATALFIIRPTYRWHHTSPWTILPSICRWFTGICSFWLEPFCIIGCS